MALYRAVRRAGIMGGGRRPDAERLRRRLGILSGAGVMKLNPQQAMRAAVAVPGVPCDEDGPVFREPWEARAFAMALALHEAAVFSWKEWAETLGAEIKRAQAAGDPDPGETYYQHCLPRLG